MISSSSKHRMDHSSNSNLEEIFRFIDKLVVLQKNSCIGQKFSVIATPTNIGFDVTEKERIATDPP